METIGSIRQTNNVAKLTKVLNAAFLTVAQELNLTSENAPSFPAFLSDDVIARQLKSGLIMFGYYEKDSLAGCIGIRNTNENGVYAIERLGVLPEYRHKNIGKYLMDYAIEQIKERKGKMAMVEIVHENGLLRKWYLDMGFVELRVDSYKQLPFTVGVLMKQI